MSETEDVAIEIELDDENNLSPLSPQSPHSPLSSTSGPSSRSNSEIAQNKSNTNVKVGPNTLMHAIRNMDCVAIGYDALRVCIAPETTAVGFGALKSTTTANGNCAVGYMSLASATEQGTSDLNTAVGHRSLMDTEASGNTGVGASVLMHNYRGESNTGVGTFVLSTNVNGSRNTAVGFHGLYGLLGGNDNTALGAGAQQAVGTYSSVTAVGSQCLADNSASENTGVGCSSMRGNQTGVRNTCVGFKTLETGLSAENCSALGHQALQSAWGKDNTAVGAFVMSKSVSTGSENTGVGSYALHSCTGSRNAALGFRCLGEGTTGHHNVGCGYMCLSNVEEGSRNVGVGAEGGQGLKSQSGNTFIGYQAGPEEDISDSVCLGANARAKHTGEFVLGSLSHPLRSTMQCSQVEGEASALPKRPAKFLRVTLNGEDYLMPLFHPDDVESLEEM